MYEVKDIFYMRMSGKMGYRQEVYVYLNRDTYWLKPEWTFTIYLN